MPTRPQQTPARSNRRPADAGWFVPATLGMLAIITILLIAFAFGVLLGVIRF